MKLNWHDPKTQAGALAVAGVVAFALYKSHARGGAAPTSAADQSGAASALGDANLQSAVYDSLEAQLSGLAAIVAKLQHAKTPKPTSPKPKPPPHQKATPRPGKHLPGPPKKKPAPHKPSNADIQAGLAYAAAVESGRAPWPAGVPRPKGA